MKFVANFNIFGFNLNNNFIFHNLIITQLVLKVNKKFQLFFVQGGICITGTKEVCRRDSVSHLLYYTISFYYFLAFTFSQCAFQSFSANSWSDISSSASTDVSPRASKTSSPSNLRRSLI